MGQRLLDWLPLIPILPLLGFFLNAFFGKRLGRGFVSFVGTGAPLAGFALALSAFLALEVAGRSSVVIVRSFELRKRVTEKLRDRLLPEFPEDRAEGVVRVAADPEEIEQELRSIPGPKLEVKLASEVGADAWHGPSVKEAGLYSDVPWISVAGFNVVFRFVFDRLSGVLALVVLGVGSLIHIYSLGYMAGEDRGGFARYFAYLNLFTGMMLVLALAGDVLLMFVGWEGVGLASYLLIGFEYREGWKADAGIKAFVVNRIGDFGFVLGVLGLALAGMAAGNNDLRIDHLNALAVAGKVAPFTLGAGALCLLLGATGKSAQIPLFVWLPDAMAGPTPVSALIHAATMVTAGVYMVCRLHPIFDSAMVPGTDVPVLGIVAAVGCGTALLAATAAVAQDDIKKVLAYSTVSQLGYMFLGCGVAAYGAAIFHLVTHAFFKALLFLGAGSVIHGTGTQDMKKMGGLREKMPTTFATMTVGAAALAGIPLMSGFFSKDMILGAALEKGSHHWAWAVVYAGGVTGGFITAFYSARLIVLTFLGKPGEASEHAHESPEVMTWPLVILAVLSVLGGFLGLPAFFGPAGEALGKFLEPVLATGEHAAEGAGREVLAMVISGAAALLGAGLGYAKYASAPLPAAEIGTGPLAPARKFLADAWRIDTLYRNVIVEPVMKFAHALWEIADVLILDRGLVDGVGRVADGVGKMFSALETGRVARYAAYLALGAAALVAAAVMGASS